MLMRSIVFAQKAGAETDGLIKGFRNQGYSVLAAHNGQEVLQLLNGNKPPTVIILNSLLEGPGALDICQYIRKKHKFSKTLILILAETPVDKKVFRDLGVHEIIAKPFSSYEIHQLISSLATTLPSQAGGGINWNRQVTGATVVITIFIAVIVYFVIIPMIVSSKSKKKNVSRFQKSMSVISDESD